MSKLKLSPTHIFAAVVLTIVGILIVPLPPFILDGLLALNILTSGTVLLISITIADPLEFAAFAPALLIATLFRLSLDVSATRLILTQGHVPGGVGEIIPAFGDFVVRGNLVVGLIIFAILITIQFIVIASGSQRVAEVAARFTLDAMPGKQMAIDADVHAGALTREAARERRALVGKEADFYGAMDGAGKFVKGDSIAALIIVVLNLIGGVAVGMLYHAMSPAEALQTYALLSIGNALVTTLPAFLMSIAMGMMVTRVAAEKSLGADLSAQMLQRPDVLRSVAVLAFGLALVPVLPRAIFAILGVLLLLASRAAQARHRATTEAGEAAAKLAKREDNRRPDQAYTVLGVDAIAIEFGTDLMAMLSPENGEALLERINDVRRMIASETGIVLPGVRIRDDTSLEPLSYVIRVRDEAAAKGTLRMDEYLALGRPETLEQIPGALVRDPVFNLSGKWIPVADREPAVARGAIIFDSISIIGSHVAEVARTRAAALFGRQELHMLVEHLRKTVPVVTKDVGTDLLPLPTLHKAFTLLLKERVWPRDPVLAIEAMLEAAATSRDPRDLAEAARKLLIGPMLRRRNLTELNVLMFDPEFERIVALSWNNDGTVPPDPALALYIRERVEAYMRTVPPAKATIICTSGFRRTLHDLLERFSISIDVFAFGELPPEIEVRPSAIVSAPNALASRPTALAS